MKNITREYLRQSIRNRMTLLFVLVVCSGVFSREASENTDGSLLSCRLVTDNFIRSIDPPTSLDTFPFFKKRNPVNPTPVEPFTSTLFPNPFPQPVHYECNILFEGRDPATGDRKKEMAPEPLFSYTAPHIKPYLPGEDLLAAECKFIRFSGGYTFLVINFEWNARNPQTSYGRLKANGAIRFSLTDDKTVTLFNNEECTWTYNAHDEKFEMQALYMLHPRQIKLLKNHPLMKATIYWEKGYEEYPIYAITLFQDQLSCLD